MNFFKNRFALLMLSGVVLFTACSDDEEDAPAAMAVSTITTTDGTNLYGSSFASGIAADQDITIGFSAGVDNTSLSEVKLLNGSNEVAASITASGNNVTIAPDDNLFGGTLYVVQVNGVKSTEGVAAGNVNTQFTTAGIGLGTAPNPAAQQVYLQLNGSVSDVTGNATVERDDVSYGEDRFGEADGAAYFSGMPGGANADLIVLDGANFISPSTTVSIWFSVDHADFPVGTSRHLFGLAAQNGFFFELGNNLDWIKMASHHMVSPDPNEIGSATAWGDNINGGGNVGGFTIENFEGDISEVVTSGSWHQMVLSFDNATSAKNIYIDGVAITKYDINNNPDPAFGFNMVDMMFNSSATNADGKFAIGFNASDDNAVDTWNTFEGNNNTFKGYVDDLRIWNVALTAEQVTSLYNDEKVQ